MPEINGELRMTAHKTRVPQKLSLSLIVGSVRILGLDVDPGGTHFNVSTKKSVRSTHWQWFPDMEAIPDERTLTHYEWLHEFCEKSAVTLGDHYESPPHEPVQLDLL